VDLSFAAETGFPPIRVQAHGIKGGVVSISGDKSSQYLSSLLMAGPYAEGDVEIEVKGDLVSKPYVNITLDVMDRFGISVLQKGPNHFSIPSGQRYKSREFIVEGDISSASYFWAAAAITGGALVTKNIFPFTTAQGDIALLDILEEMGCTVLKKQDRVTVSGRELNGIEVDMAALPDMVPTLAAIALFAKGKTAIRNVPHLHHKESNRIEDVAEEYRRLGGHVEPLRDGLIIHGQCPLKGVVVNPHDDHRLAMSLAIIGLKVPGIRLENEACVGKSFPTFWELFDRL
jgi:3-phosphoshikimate 1-carboxyvinyltransferase